MGTREGSTDRLELAVAAFEQTLLDFTRDQVPMKWAAAQNNLGLARRWLGALTKDIRQFQAAQAAFSESWLQHTRDVAPFYWAQKQWNLGDLFLAWHAVAPDPALRVTARDHLEQARAVFAAGDNAHQITECDRLLAEVQRP